jgi:hypothetical protein
VLVLAVGNPSRGDDALGPAFIDRVAALLDAAVDAGELELLTDFQLSAEHALDLAGREEVVFVDASVSCAAPFAWTQAVPAHDPTYVAVHGSDPPPARVLAIRGEAFELGAPLSAAATANLDAAVRSFVERFAARTD